MNKTLIIYDNNGKIFSMINSGYEVPQGGINFIEVDTVSYEGKIIKSVNVVDKTLILEDSHLSEIDILKQKIAEQETALVELASLVGGNA